MSIISASSIIININAPISFLKPKEDPIKYTTEKKIFHHPIAGDQLGCEECSNLGDAVTGSRRNDNENGIEVSDPVTVTVDPDISGKMEETYSHIAGQGLWLGRPSHKPPLQPESRKPSSRYASSQTPQTSIMAEGPMTLKF